MVASSNYSKSWQAPTWPKSKKNPGAGIVSGRTNPGVSKSTGGKKSSWVQRFERKVKKVVNSKRPTKQNTVDGDAKNRRVSGIPTSAKKLYESRYFEVYQDSKTGKKYLWGKPTISLGSALSHPYSAVREWWENAERFFGGYSGPAKYLRKDPVYRDMGKIRKQFGHMDEISGYSRGGASANYQKYDKNTKYREYGMFTPWNLPDRRIRNRAYKKFDPVHKVARAYSKLTRKRYKF